MLQLTANEIMASAIHFPVLTDLNIAEGPAYDFEHLQDSLRLSSDLTLARAVQRQMLPRNTKRLSTVKYSAISAAAGVIGGDYYDFLDLGPDSLGILLADVSGKGVAAALLMANLQASIRCECTRGFQDLGAMLERVNSQFFETTLPQQYATLFLAQYDDRTRRLHYINCAQQPVMVVRADGSIERLQTTALPLGIVANWSGEQNSIELRRGDTLCVCSDGVIEAGLEEGTEFGEDGLIAVAAGSRDQDIEQVVMRIAHVAQLHRPTDDMTVVGIRGV